MRARDVMVRAVATTTPKSTVEELARLMINLRISGVPVIDKDGRLVGIVTEGDLLRRAETGTERHRASWSQSFVFEFSAGCRIHQVACQAGGGHHDHRGGQRRGNGDLRRDRRSAGDKAHQAAAGRA